MLESKLDIRMIQALLGHKRLDTTAHYTRVATDLISKVVSPLGGYVACCENAACGHTVIAYCSCRNRHCPKCQGAAAREWLAEREAELLPVPYFHVVYTLPAPIADILPEQGRHL